MLIVSPGALIRSSRRGQHVPCFSTQRTLPPDEPELVEYEKLCNTMSDLESRSDAEQARLGYDTESLSRMAPGVGEGEPGPRTGRGGQKEGPGRSSTATSPGKRQGGRQASRIAR